MDERQCRICFGSDETDDNRLFRPCLCSGTQAYIHEACLTAWRESAVNTQYFYRCAVCQYAYRLRRLGIYHLITHWFSLSLLTLLVLCVAITTGAYGVKLFLLRFDPSGERLILGLDLTGTTPLSLPWQCVLVAFCLIGFVALITAPFCHDFRPHRNDDDDHGRCCPDGGSGCRSPLPGECLVIIIVLAMIGVFLLAVWIYGRLRDRMRPLLYTVGNQVLEIKKTQ